MVESIDIYPALCELTGISRPADLQGVSFVPLLRNPERAGKSAVFMQYLRDGIWKAPDGLTYMGRCIRTERYRYVEWRQWPNGTVVARELYDLIQDPGENVNVAEIPGNRSIRSALSARLRRQR